MAAGADSIADLDALRHGGMDTLFDGIRAPSTLGSFLRSLKWGNVRQIEKVSRELVVRLATHAPLLPAADTVAFLDVDSMQKRSAGGQDELFSSYRYHAVFTDSPFHLAQAEEQHRDHAIVEQVFADLVCGPFAHLPSGDFAANAAWLTCAAINRSVPGLEAVTTLSTLRGS
ncbi:hypothetical protein ACQP1V_24975 [Microtetraspora malaysiensis]|uniref:hypothetical protein n=1 Tax=Microtetraspora malaysiensis TaxID=161358 RepID=UPI003D94947B